MVITDYNRKKASEIPSERLTKQATEIETPDVEAPINVSTPPLTVYALQQSLALGKSFRQLSKTEKERVRAPVRIFRHENFPFVSRALHYIFDRAVFLPSKLYRQIDITWLKRRSRPDDGLMRPTPLNNERNNPDLQLEELHHDILPGYFGDITGNDYVQQSSDDLYPALTNNRFSPSAFKDVLSDMTDKSNTQVSASLSHPVSPVTLVYKSAGNTEGLEITRSNTRKSKGEIELSTLMKRHQEKGLSEAVTSPTLQREETSHHKPAISAHNSLTPNATVIGEKPAATSIKPVTPISTTRDFSITKPENLAEKYPDIRETGTGLKQKEKSEPELRRGTISGDDIGTIDGDTSEAGEQASILKTPSTGHGPSPEPQSLRAGQLVMKPKPDNKNILYPVKKMAEPDMVGDNIQRDKLMHRNSVHKLSDTAEENTVKSVRETPAKSAGSTAAPQLVIPDNESIKPQPRAGNKAADGMILNRDNRPAIQKSPDKLEIKTAHKAGNKAENDTADASKTTDAKPEMPLKREFMTISQAEPEISRLPHVKKSQKDKGQTFEEYLNETPVQLIEHNSDNNFISLPEKRLTDNDTIGSEKSIQSSIKGTHANPDGLPLIARFLSREDFSEGIIRNHVEKSTSSDLKAGPVEVSERKVTAAAKKDLRKSVQHVIQAMPENLIQAPSENRPVQTDGKSKELIDDRQSVSLAVSDSAGPIAKQADRKTLGASGQSLTVIGEADSMQVHETLLPEIADSLYGSTLKRYPIPGTPTGRQSSSAGHLTAGQAPVLREFQPESSIKKAKSNLHRQPGLYVAPVLDNANSQQEPDTPGIAGSKWSITDRIPVLSKTVNTLIKGAKIDSASPERHPLIARLSDRSISKSQILAGSLENISPEKTERVFLKNGGEVSSLPIQWYSGQQSLNLPLAAQKRSGIEPVEDATRQVYRTAPDLSTDSSVNYYHVPKPVMTATAGKVESRISRQSVVSEPQTESSMDGEKNLDIRDIADRVFALLKREIKIERERDRHRLLR